MSFYSDAAQTAQDLLAEFGQDVTLRRITRTYEPITAAVTAATKAEGVIKGAVIPIGKRDSESMDDRMQQALRAGKLRKLLLEAKAAPFEPAVNDILVVTGMDDVLHIKGVTPLKPAGTAVLFTVFAEQGALSTADAAAT